MLTKYRFAVLAFGVVLAGMMAGCNAIGPSDTTTTTQAVTTTSTSTSTSTSTTSTTMVLTKDYYPNADGNVWIYQTLDFMSGSTTEATAEATFNGTQAVDGLTAQIQIISGGAVETQEALIIATNSDVKEYGGPDGPTTEANIRDLLFPSVVGDRWEYDLVGDITTTEPLAVESVSVPAGTFNCFRVRIVGPSGPTGHPENIFWYAKDVGLVKWITGYFLNSGAPFMTRTFNLISKNF